MDSLDLLRTFQEVARLGSFARAAHRLDLAKANVSKHIARLEQHFGTRLFHRTTRAVRLTDAGALLLARSEPLLAMMDATRAELQGRAHAPAGRLRISAPHGLAPLGLHELLVVSRELRHLIQTSARAEQLQLAGMLEGMRTLRQDGILKVLAGLTSFEEVRAISNS